MEYYLKLDHKLQLIIREIIFPIMSYKNNIDVASKISRAVFLVLFICGFISQIKLPAL